ncbi:MAG: hypothetical protein ABJJ09_17100 [Ascidiaceihabitans sp.]|uniref:hypothetical protein n=1 Tax=Ascidiaceihabitans sp. TaxID=1872644 RepID=UPI00329A476F
MIPATTSYLSRWALGLSLDETIGQLGFSNAEVREFVDMNRNLPDLWDLAQGTWEECSGPSRFKEDVTWFCLCLRAWKTTPSTTI